MKVLVTGGAGFIGCHIVKGYLGEGASLFVIDDLSRKGSDLNLKWLYEQGDFEFFRIDLKEYGRLSALFEENSDIEIVYHMGAQVAVTESIRDPRRDFDTNLLGTFNLLEAIRNSRCRPILIYASTNKVYGALEDLEVVERDCRYDYARLAGGISEDRNLDFHSPYGCSKGAAEQYVRDYSRMFGIRSVVFRQSCIYGPRQMGCEDQGWLAWFILAGLSGRPVTIYGNGKQVRDVLFIDDLLEAYHRAACRIEAVSGEIFNIGGGRHRQLSILQLLDVLREQFGISVHTT
ncbi:MAG: NAD-dependent epimerase/dehydratase family protein, partial [Candidatus Binatia bacterium]